MKRPVWSLHVWLKAYGFFHSEDLEKDVEFEVVGDSPEKVGPKPSEPISKNITNGSDDGAQPSTSTGKEYLCDWIK